jgi:chromosome segregation protein
MDKGAHFYKCDFQVHSPRDNQWTGNRFGFPSVDIATLTPIQIATLTTEREQFAREYLDKVRQQGLNAIAITDHHDIAFAKVIRKVAQEENAVFEVSGELHKKITVFPGIELTLDSPICQCLILFDADFPDNHLSSVLNTLGIAPSHEHEEQTAQVVRISSAHVQDLPNLHKKLDELPYCVGRYIILPNVNSNGGSTIFRRGGNATYKKMPCVGGYVDKALPTDAGWLNKTNGGDVNYGNKSIGVISTSDNRFEDGREFGNYYTWIKWSEPSAEALRQACLAKESRISQTTPVLPQISITQLEVTSSKFMGSFVVQFNQQYNALIGGRGTGKSTLLEYLRWGLCDQTVHSASMEELNEIEKRRKVLIEKTLIPVNGEVRVTFSLNGVNHIVKRNSATNDILLKIGDGSFQNVSVEDIRRILPIQAYSQKQLSSVGVTTDELKRFIQSPIQSNIENLNFRLEENVTKSRRAYLNLLRKKTIEKEIEQFSLEIKSLNDRVNALRKSLSGISPEDQATIARKSVMDNEENYVSGVRRELNTISGKVNELDVFLQNYPEPFPTSPFENDDLLRRLFEKKSEKINEIKGLVTQMKEALKPESNTDIRSLIAEWQNLKNNFDALYEAAKSRTTSNQELLAEIQRIEERLSQLNATIGERNELLRQLGNPSDEFNALRMEYWQMHDDKAQMLHQQAQNFTILSKGQIKVEVLKNLDYEFINAELTKALQGTRINYDKMQAICDSIAESGKPLQEWDEILKEFRLLAEINTQTGSNPTIPATPKLSAVCLNTGNIQRIAEVLTTDSWLSLATMNIEFTPDFQFSTNNVMGDVIPFSEASAGQQATALLTVLLSQPGAPLIIDQPEDDIDNRAIEDIIKNIWEAKRQRQLIFTSHNANLVVNGDAELVICCDYKDSGSQTRGDIKAQGAIDSNAVKKEITSVMEGGEKAFKLRKDKYGF